MQHSINTNAKSVNHNTPAKIRKRIATLCKQVKMQQRIKKLLQEEQSLKVILKMSI